MRRIAILSLLLVSGCLSAEVRETAATNLRNVRNFAGASQPSVAFIAVVQAGDPDHGVPPGTEAQAMAAWTEMRDAAVRSAHQLEEATR